MKRYKLNIQYKKKGKNNYKILLDDNKKQLIVIISIYEIRNNLYLDIAIENIKIHTGQKINLFEDLFYIVKSKYNFFPNVSLRAVPINYNGLYKEFDINTAGVLQDLILEVIDE